MSVTALPPDAVEASELARELARARGEKFDRVYNRMKLWWTRGAVDSWKRGDGRVLVSTSQIMRRFADLERIEYRPREGEEGED